MEDYVLRKLTMLAERTREWNNKPEAMPTGTRDEFQMMFASVFREFEDFAEVGMRFLGFKLTPVQRDIAKFMQHGPKKRMVQAQRGQAKSTLAALYAVWCLIQNPSYRVLVVSGGEAQASDVATLIIRLVMQWHILCWLRPDKGAGDRTSFENFDVHHSLRRVDKTASVSCVGITAQLQGKRADLIIPDDVETQKNSMTQIMRDKLMLLTKEFAAICIDGETLYLGTPQTKDSIYNTLPARGFTIRVWPGRYPTQDERERYLEGTVAPSILEAVERNPALARGGGLDGTRGQPTDPTHYGEEKELEKELDYGPEGYQLQYMLDTSLADAARTRVLLSDMPVYQCGYDRAPEVVSYGTARHLLIEDADLRHPAITKHKLYRAANTTEAFCQYNKKVLSVDPAGSGGDEVAFAAGGSCNGYIHLFTVGGLRGGVSEVNINKIIDVAVEMEIPMIRIEQNMGHGTVDMLFIAELAKRKISTIGVEGFYNSTQKEKRIIDAISPVTRRHRLVVHDRALRDDYEYCRAHSVEKRTAMSAFYQLANITYDRGSLAHDDRADAIADVVVDLSKTIALDDEKAQEVRDALEARKFYDNPMDYLVSKPKFKQRVKRL